MSAEAGQVADRVRKVSGWLRSPLALVLVGLLVLLTRWMGASWGLPSAENVWGFHPDEPLVWFYSQQIDLAKGDLFPTFYNYGTLYLFLANIAGNAAQAYSGDLKEVWQVLGVQIMAGRWITMLAGAALGVMVYAYALRFMRATGAVFAALAIVVAPGLVVHGRFQTVDVLAATLAFASLFAAGMALPTERGKQWTVGKAALWAGVFAGLSAGAKYSGIVSLIGLAPVLWVSAITTREKAKWFAVAFLASLVAFVVSTPGVLGEPAAFRAHFAYELEHTSTGHGLVFVGTPPAPIYHFINLFEGYGLLLVFFSLYGAFMGAKQRNVHLAGPLLFALVTYVVIARAEVKFLRYTLPLIPPLALAFGYAVSEWHRKGSTGARLGVVGAFFAVSGLGMGGAMGAAKYTVFMTMPDPRESAASFLREQAKPGQTVGFVSPPWFYSVPLYPLATAPRFVPPEQRAAAMAEANPPVVVTEGEWNLALFDQRPDFIVFSSFEVSDRLRIREIPNLDPAYKAPLDAFLAFEKRLAEEYELARPVNLGPDIHDMIYVQPRIWIYRRKATSQTPATNTSTTSDTSEAPANTP